MEIEVTDLDSLKEACEEIGLEFREGQETYKWFGASVGDTPIPEGVDESQLGHCAHALRVRGKPGAYEIGVVPNATRTGYHLLWDFWAGGYGLRDAIGDEGSKLLQKYTEKKVLKETRKAGFRLANTERNFADGSIKLTLRR
jgi:hypothetical protein